MWSLFCNICTTWELTEWPLDSPPLVTAHETPMKGLEQDAQAQDCQHQQHRLCTPWAVSKGGGGETRGRRGHPHAGWGAPRLQERPPLSGLCTASAQPDCSAPPLPRDPTTMADRPPQLDSTAANTRRRSGLVGPSCAGASYTERPPQAAENAVIPSLGKLLVLLLGHGHQVQTDTQESW